MALDGSETEAIHGEADFAETKNAQKSPYLDAYLEERRDKLASEENYKFDINDVGYFFNARGRDIANKSIDADAKKKFKTMAEIVENARAGKEMSLDQQEDIIEYLTDYYKDLEGQATAHPEKIDPEIEGNLKIFESLILAVKEQPTSDETTHGDKVDTHTQVREESARDQAQLPEYRYKPGEKLEAFFKKERSGSVTLETVRDFVTAARDDLRDQEKVFERENEGLIAAVDKASEFGIAHIAERDSRGFIKVVEANGTLQVGWEESLEDVKGKVYLFDPRVSSDSVNLGDYILRRNQYADKIKGTEQEGGAEQAIQQLEALMAKSRSKMAEEELLPISRVLSRHEEYLEESLSEISLRFDGLEDEAMVEAANADQESAKKLTMIEQQLDLTRELKKQVKMREKSGRDRKFKGIQKIRSWLPHKKTSKE